jgi:hypothetical protein
VIEVLHPRLELVREPGLHALEHVVGRRLVAGEAEGAVAAIVFSDVVQVPQISLESGVVSVGCGCGAVDGGLTLRS